MARARRRLRTALLVLGLALAACQPLPQPFSHNGNPDLALLAVPDHGGIIVLAISDAPPATAEGLATAMVEALHAANVPASRQGGNRDSAFLQGRVEDDGRNARLVWDLFDGAGGLIGTHAQPIEGTPIAAWRAAEPALMAALAAASAADIAALIQQAEPVERASPRVLVLPIEDAPEGDAGRLAAAVRAALATTGLEVVEAPDGTTVTLAGRLAITALDGGDEAVEIVWTVHDPNGRRLGMIRQADRLPAGSLAKQWEAVAATVAVGTAEGVADLLERVEWRPLERAGSAR